MVENNKEIWKDVPNYEGYYQASNLGRVRSLDRTVIDSMGRRRFYKGMIIEGHVNKDGYKITTFKKDNVGRTYSFSQLVMMTFFGHKPNGNILIIDHKNGDRSDDKLSNLRIVTNRDNITTCFRSDRDSLSSDFIGVYWHKLTLKWSARIDYQNRQIYLGLFKDDLEASMAYQSALSKIKDGTFNPDDYKPKYSSKYKGVSFNKRDNRWVAYRIINGKQKYVGSFKTELEASKATKTYNENVQAQLKNKT